ncbi:hypothetical protein B6N60_04566 [Richelia sinica FACHB-800]|uniref:Uncharacterized protein n=1 Tax=Richelia sinica FACHB-800 TaxID=1357546 RepID=A0A975Y709_9NOST|nr:hypothetical protein [Richelia sinica]MBD2667180.1 hypothetical protein [Richelia sinica FACHB-800]QXE25846.1 hypothetical protein B6N60_04566 [Richelia sinica FACHB-800]
MTRFTFVGKPIRRFTQTAFAVLPFFLTFSSVVSPAFAESLQVGDKSFEIIDDIKIVINRESIDEQPMQVNQNGNRYKILRFLPALTQEKEIEPLPGQKKKPNLLYRLAQVQDQQTGKTLTVALPIIFNPPIKQIGL